MTLVRRFDSWLHAEAPAERLAALRIAIGGFVTIYLLANVREFTRLADAPAANFTPIGLASVLAEPLSSTALAVLFAALTATGVAFTVGFRVRVFGPAFALLTLFWASYHSSWGQLLHFEHLFTIHLLILAIAPTADAWAVGTKRNVATAAKHLRYGWPIRLLALATVATYVLSGIAKLKHTGLAWFDPDTLATHIGYSATRMETIGGTWPPLAQLVLQNRSLVPLLAASALVVELGAPLALFNQRLRNGWVGLALLFHLGTAATMLVFFGYRGLGIALLPLFAVERLPAWLAARRKP